jgi:hypothetical protein
MAGKSKKAPKKVTKSAAGNVKGGLNFTKTIKGE